MLCASGIDSGLQVLHMSLSPDGETVCSAAADETLRFWKVRATLSSEHATSMPQWARLATLDLLGYLPRSVSVSYVVGNRVLLGQ